MTVAEFAKAGGFTEIILPDPEMEIDDIYVGDLLSWVMGKAQVNDLWITIMSNVNIVAVASLTGVACVLLAEGVTPDEDALNAAKARGINILSSKETASHLAVKADKILSAEEI